LVTGKVKWFNDSKGYGFVTADDGTDAFVHHSDILGEGFKTLAEGDKVEFELTSGPKGPKAVNVRKV
jgi:CspA family cold shock protein